MAVSAEAKAQWLSDRAGRLTASRMNDAMSFLKDGKTPSAARTKYMMDLLAERLTGYSTTHYVNDAMEWGSSHEDEAVDFFVERYPQYSPKVSRFYEHPTIGGWGATPDRELGEDALIEVKCPTSATFIGWVMGKIAPIEHRNQMCAQLLCTGRKYCVFLAYDPRVRDEKRRMFIRKYEPSLEELAAVEAGAIKFLDELEAMFDAVVSSAP